MMALWTSLSMRGRRTVRLRGAAVAGDGAAAGGAADVADFAAAVADFADDVLAVDAPVAAARAVERDVDAATRLARST